MSDRTPKGPRDLSSGIADAPDLDLESLRKPSTSNMKVPTLDVFKPANAAALEASAPPPSSRKAPAPASALAPKQGPSIAFTESDDDDFDMQIERNLTTSAAPAHDHASSAGSTPRGMATAQARRPGGGIASTGLELAARPQGHVARTTHGEVSTAAKVVGLVLASISFAGTPVLLVRFAHRAGGISVTGLLPHAFDGTSATQSGAVALGAVVVSVVLGFGGLRVTPRSWIALASAGIMLLLALAMVTVTLASSGENPTPPDGARLVPYLLPLSTLLLGLGVAGQGYRLFARGGVARRLATVPVCAIAGALAFVAFEISPFVR